LPPNDGEVGSCIGDLVLCAREIVSIRDDQIGELTDLKTALLALLVREPGDVVGPHPQRRLAVEAVVLQIESETADRFAGDEPSQGYPRIIGGDPRSVGAR